NTGKSDSELFVPGAQANPYYSFVSDTAAYFLTWTLTTPGKRVSVYSNTNYSSFTPQNYYLHHSLFYGTYNSNATDNGYNYGQPSNPNENVYGSNYSVNESYSSVWVGLTNLNLS